MINCVFSNEAAMYDVTPLENIFISEYLPRAEGEYVKAYIYGLMLCRNPQIPASDIGTALDMTEKELLEAFTYWQKKELVFIASEDPLEIRYLSPRQSINKNYDRRMGTHTELIRHIQGIFGTRALSMHEMRHIFDWVDVFGISEEAVIVLIEYAVNKKGVRVSMNYMESIAKNWADNGIITASQATAHIADMGINSSAASRIAKRWRLSRRVTEDEERMYEKWTRGWGFTEESIDAICAAEVVKATNPSFAYLDRILDAYRHKGNISPEEVDNEQRRQTLLYELAREVFSRAGIKRSATQKQRDEIERWVETWHMPKELIVYAGELAANESSPYQFIKRIVALWHENGIDTIKAADDRLLEIKEKLEYGSKSSYSNKIGKPKGSEKVRNFEKHDYDDSVYKSLEITFLDD